MQLPKRLTLLCLSASVGACTVGPDYVRPAATLPPAFSSANGTASTDADLRLWWRGFGDPVLDRLVEQALTGNLDLEQAAARIDQAGAALGLARSALLPNGEIAASYTRSYDSIAAPPGAFLQEVPGGYPRDQDSFRINGGASWEIDVFGGKRRGVEAARADFVATVADAQAARIGMIGTLVSSYVTLRRVQAERMLTVERLALQRRDSALSNLLSGRGIIARSDAQGVFAQLSTDEARLPTLEQSASQLTNAIDVLLGAAPGTNRALLAQASAIPAAAPPDPGTPVDLLRRRPDVIAAEARLRGANARIGQAIAEYYPKFSLSGLLGLSSLTGGALFTGRAVEGRGGLGISWRIFDFARIDAEIAQARGADREVLAAYRAAVLVAARDVEDAIARIQAAGATLASRTAALADRGRVREAAHVSFARGATSERDRLIVDQAFVATKIEVTAARAERADAIVQLYRAIGGGWTAPASVPASVEVAGRADNSADKIKQLAAAPTEDGR